MRFDDVALGYEEGVNILDHLDIYVDYDDRIGILGKNGEGKSTFRQGYIRHAQALVWLHQKT